MLQPAYNDFCQMANEGNLIPVYREYLADMETPVSAFSRFVAEDYAFLLESVEGGERWGRLSFIGLHPYAIFSVREGKAYLRTVEGEQELPFEGSPFESLRGVLADIRPVAVPGLPRFFGGAVGFLGYETVAEFEQLPPSKGETGWPESCLMLTDELVIFDNVRHTIKIVACARLDEHDSLESAYEDADKRIERVAKKLAKPYLPGKTAAAVEQVEVSRNMAREDFVEMVARAKQYIVDGDIIQVVLSQQFTAHSTGAPLDLYRALRLINPSPYTFCLKFKDQLLVGSSPEVMVRMTGSRAELRPIAGTRRRGANEQEDRSLADELLADEKERAEHVMLVDLGRNDLGRVAVPGSVQVRDFMTIERYSHVMHIVSHIEADLLKGVDAFDLVRATFPAGTLSGAPKIRAMEIINELETSRRGPYGGAVGYIGFDGNMDLAITIRTLQLDGEEITVQAGAGIVYDSDPEREYEETVEKVGGMLQALELAAAGLDLAVLDGDAKETS